MAISTTTPVPIAPLSRNWLGCRCGSKVWKAIGAPTTPYSAENRMASCGAGERGQGTAERGAAAGRAARQLVASTGQCRRTRFR